MLITAGETRGVNNKNTTTQNGLNQQTFYYNRRLGDNFSQHVVQIQSNIPLVASINN